MLCRVTEKKMDTVVVFRVEGLLLSGPLRFRA